MIYSSLIDWILNPLAAVVSPQCPAPLLIPGQDKVLGQDLLAFPASLCQKNLTSLSKVRGGIMSVSPPKSFYWCNTFSTINGNNP